mgnify:CR=1 FL=1
MSFFRRKNLFIKKIFYILIVFIYSCSSTPPELSGVLDVLGNEFIKGSYDGPTSGFSWFTFDGNNLNVEYTTQVNGNVRRASENYELKNFRYYGSIDRNGKTKKTLIADWGNHTFQLELDNRLKGTLLRGEKLTKDTETIDVQVFWGNSSASWFGKLNGDQLEKLKPLFHLEKDDPLIEKHYKYKEEKYNEFSSELSDDVVYQLRRYLNFNKEVIYNFPLRTNQKNESFYKNLFDLECQGSGCGRKLLIKFKSKNKEFSKYRLKEEIRSWVIKKYKEIDYSLYKEIFLLDIRKIDKKFIIDYLGFEDYKNYDVKKSYIDLIKNPVDQEIPLDDIYIKFFKSNGKVDFQMFVKYHYVEWFEEYNKIDSDAFKKSKFWLEHLEDTYNTTYYESLNYFREFNYNDTKKNYFDYSIDKLLIEDINDFTKNSRRKYINSEFKKDNIFKGFKKLNTPPGSNLSKIQDWYRSYYLRFYLYKIVYDYFKNNISKFDWEGLVFSKKDAGLFKGGEYVPVEDNFSLFLNLSDFETEFSLKNKELEDKLLSEIAAEKSGRAKQAALNKEKARLKKEKADKLARERKAAEKKSIEKYLKSSITIYTKSKGFLYSKTDVFSESVVLPKNTPVKKISDLINNVWYRVRVEDGKNKGKTGYLHKTSFEE